MAGLATHADDERRSINVHRNIGSCVGTAIGAVACFPLLNLFGALGDNGSLDPTNGSRGFFLTACVMAAVCIGGCLVHYFTTKERVVPENKEEEHVGIQCFFYNSFPTGQLQFHEFDRSITICSMGNQKNLNSFIQHTLIEMQKEADVFQVLFHITALNQIAKIVRALRFGC